MITFFLQIKNEGNVGDNFFCEEDKNSIENIGNNNEINIKIKNNKMNQKIDDDSDENEEEKADKKNQNKKVKRNLLI